MFQFRNHFVAMYCTEKYILVFVRATVQYSDENKQTYPARAGMTFNEINIIAMEKQTNQVGF